MSAKDNMTNKTKLDELRSWWKDNWIKTGKDMGDTAIMNKVDELLSAEQSQTPKPAAKVEPLAVLCERMGYRMRWSKDDGRDMWHISLRPRRERWVPKQIVHAPTYPACEAKARAWLGRLEDKGGR